MAKKVIQITENRLKQLIKEQIKQQFPSKKVSILSEGVHYDNSTKSFVFDFEHDNQTDIIKLEHIGYAIEDFGRCFYYGYECANDVNSDIRTKFIHYIKFPESFENDKDLNLFINKAIDYLDKQITIPKYNVVIIPESMSELNRKMLSSLSRRTSTKYMTFELIKEVASKIEFDYERYKYEVLDSYVNGQPRYTEKQKQEALSKINELMKNIHNKDYFSIARDVKKCKYRQYISNYYKFPNEEIREKFKSLTNANIILVDDIVTSGTTIYHLLNTLRCINDSNNIVVFSLIGKDTLI